LLNLPEAQRMIEDGITADTRALLADAAGNALARRIAEQNERAK
jgi:hypothetical protein